MKPLITKDQTVGDFFWLWPLFCLQAGLINSGGFLACHRFVSHITGFGTRVGMEFLQDNLLMGIEMMLIPVGFILGCTVSGYYNESKKNKFEIPLFLVSFLLLVVSILGELNVFGPFGEPLILTRDFFLLFLLCFTSGIQNALLASLTGGIIRSTHMTGIATDIGLSLVRVFKNKNEPEKAWLHLRLWKIILFSLGATSGTLLFFQFQYSGFLIVGILNVLLSYFLKKKILKNMAAANQAQLSHGQLQGNVF